MFSCLVSLIWIKKKISGSTLYMHVCSLAQSCMTLGDSIDCSPPGSSLHGISQAKILEWVALSFPRGSSQQGSNQHLSSCLYCRWILSPLSLLASPSLCSLTNFTEVELVSGCTEPNQPLSKYLRSWISALKLFPLKSPKWLKSWRNLSVPIFLLSVWTWDDSGSALAEGWQTSLERRREGNIINMVV